MEVMLKPHIWSREFGNGVDWHGTIAMDDEAEWATFFENYTAYIVSQARFAQETGADALCLGVEMKLTTHRETEWRKLIAEVRKVFDGHLTYAANADEFNKIAWWDAVDAIGITAYFTLSENKPATEAEVRQTWGRILDEEIAPVAQRFGKPVIYAELSYSASANAAHLPSEHHETEPVDHDYQAMLYRVAMEEANRRDFMAGVFLWKWFTASDEAAARMERREVFVLQTRTPTLAVLGQQWTLPQETGPAE